MLEPTGEDSASETFWEKYKRLILIVSVFVVTFVSARVSVSSINNSDYNGYIATLRTFWSGQSPYDVRFWQYPPWSFFILAPLVNQPIETWLALTVAIFTTMVIDMGKPAGLLLLLNPVFITLLVSSNGEWLFVGPGLLLLYHAPKGWGRGLAWLFLTCKPQATAFLLFLDGWDALRERDWKAFALTGVVALTTVLMYPHLFKNLGVQYEWSVTVLSNYGVIGAAVVTAFIVAVRWKRLDDRRTFGLLLGPVWSPYMLQYSCTAMLFTMRGAGWWRNALYLAASIGLVAVFWQDYHGSEQVGILGMVVLAAVLAPAYPQDPVKPPETP